MNIAEIELKLRDLVQEPFNKQGFLFSFLAIYGAPKATLTKLRQGSNNQSKAPGDILWKNKIFYRATNSRSPANVLDAMAGDTLVTKNRPRFLFVTNGREVCARDIKLDDNIGVDLARLNDHFDFFLPLAGIERHKGVAENPADIKAAGRLAKLYDAILAANPSWRVGEHTHELNLLMTRMLFCFFAEDTDIFEPRLFTDSVMTLSSEDGSDTGQVLEALFRVMSTPPMERESKSAVVKRFPYVNGGLFSVSTPVPTFSGRARRLFKECGDLHWRDINPDIFGSMIQAIVEPGMRGDLGMHYTSVPNIMKVLQPLFLFALEDDFLAAYDSQTKLNKLLQRIYSIRIFDPACGSGNFLIIAYRELRKLEMRIFDRILTLGNKRALPMTGVLLKQFFGVELADFACETAKLSLWISEYQMNAQFKETFGTCPPTLPLRDSGNIVHGNALRLDWLKVCPKKQESETFVIGNPPYLGRGVKTQEQKDDMIAVFADQTNFKKLDYVACWTFKGANYCNVTGAQCAFVTTNSICQGEQVALLWPLILACGIEIGFAHQSFKWKNNASDNAGVTCVIVGLRTTDKPSKKVLYSGDHSRIVKNIGPYLIESDDLIVYPVSNAATKYPLMTWGNMPRDDGNLLLTAYEKDSLLRDYPEASVLLRRLYGSQEFIKGIERWCLWIEDPFVELARSIPPIERRLEKVREVRLASTAASTVESASRPHRFAQIQTYGKESIIMPTHSSERRSYLPVGIISSEHIISNAAFAIYDPEPYLFAILSSRLHIMWTSAAGGHLEDRLRYSNTLVYNTFPLPGLSDAQKSILEKHAFNILATRESHPGKTIDWLYSPETMPADIVRSHQELDAALEQMYIGRTFRDDTERLEHLFGLYAKHKEKRDRQTSLLAAVPTNGKKMKRA